MDGIALQQLFPTKSEIPPQFLLPEPVHQTSILIGGELKPWTGPMHKVHSPILLREGQKLVPVEIGSYPEATATESAAALAAAVAAYDKGRGIWPTMSVAERIACVQDFTRQMVAWRNEVVRLIMWEIGKSLADFRKGVRPHRRIYPRDDQRSS